MAKEDNELGTKHAKSPEDHEQKSQDRLEHQEHKKPEDNKESKDLDTD